MSRHRINAVMAALAAKFTQAAQACLRGHPRLFPPSPQKGVDGRNKSGHDS
jgi:hypothetical protein